MKKILVTPRSFCNEGKIYLEKLEKAGFDVIFNNSGRRFSKQEFLEKIKDVHGVIVGNEDLSAEVIKDASKLQIISKYGVGLDNIDLDYAHEKGIMIESTIGANTTSVTEMVFLLMLAASRRFSQLINPNSVMNHQRIIGKELKNKTLGIIGLGAIGRQVAQYAQAFSMDVFAYDPFVQEAPDNVTLIELERLLSQAEIITLHLPLTKITENFMNQDLFDLVEKGTIIINTSRAEIVEEDALTRWLLESGDNFYAEDVEIDRRNNQLAHFSNYLITPHAATFTKEADRNMMKISTDYLLSFFKDKQ